MYVAKLEISGVRGFDGPRAVNLDFTRPGNEYAGWTVLAGRNGAGKTTLLQSIALALAGPSVAQVFQRSLQGWINRSRHQARVHASLAGEPEGADQLFLEGMPFSTTLVWERPESSADQLDLGWQLPPKLVVQGDQAVIGDRFVVGYGPFRRLIGGHSTGGSWDPSFAGGLVTLFESDAALTEAVDWLRDRRFRALEHQPGQAELIEGALALLADGLLPDGFAIEKVDADGLWVRRSESLFPLQELSDGYRTVVAVVLDIIARVFVSQGRLDIEDRNGVSVVPTAGVVLIDEVDAHLHVSWQKKIGEWLKTHFPEIQFIVTTHSPYICQSADPGGLIRLPGPDEEQPPQAVDEDLYHRVVYGSGDDAVLTELFGVETPYSDKAERLRDRLGDLEGKVLDALQRLWLNCLNWVVDLCGGGSGDDSGWSARLVGDGCGCARMR